MPKDSLKSGYAPDEMGYHSVHPPLRLGGGVGILEFRVLGGGQNILDFRGGGGCAMRWVYFLGGGQFILHSFSHFEMQDFKNSKLACSGPFFNIHIFRLKIDALLQIDVHLNLNFLIQ